MSKQAEVFFDSLSDDARVYLKKKKGEMQTEEALAALTHRLTSFLSYLEDNALLDITEDVTTEWIASLSHYADRTINNYICDVQGFLEFENIWRATHYFVPECIKQDDIYQPHFFSEDEKKRLYNVIDNYIPGRRCFLPWIRLEFPMVVRICDGCGTRITETLRLKMRDVNLETGVLKFVKAKNNNQRYVPMTQGLTDILRKYCSAMGIIDNPEAFLFPRKTRDEPLVAYDISHKFINAMIEVGIISDTSGQKKKMSRGPCFHNLRHTFAISSLKAALAKGMNQEEFLEILSIYLGHESLSETQKYLKFIVEVFPEELDKIDQIVDAVLGDEDVWEKYGL